MGRGIWLNKSKVRKYLVGAFEEKTGMQEMEFKPHCSWNGDSSIEISQPSQLSQQIKEMASIAIGRSM